MTTNMNEILNDSELEQIAGGNGWETRQDAAALRSMGRLSSRNANKSQVNDAFWNLGLGIGTELHNGDKSNRYYINHRKVSREELWHYINQHYRDW